MKTNIKVTRNNMTKDKSYTIAAHTPSCYIEIPDFHVTATNEKPVLMWTKEKKCPYLYNLQ
jgi:hypothetical protein